MAMGDLFARFFRWFHGQGRSRDTARNRLQLILIQDRAGIDPGILDALRDDLIFLMRKYFEIEDEGIEVELQREGDSTALVANIPIRKLKGRRAEEFRESATGIVADEPDEEAAPVAAATAFASEPAEPAPEATPEVEPESVVAASDIADEEGTVAEAAASDEEAEPESDAASTTQDAEVSDESAMSVEDEGNKDTGSEGARENAADAPMEEPEPCQSDAGDDVSDAKLEKTRPTRTRSHAKRARRSSRRRR